LFCCQAECQSPLSTFAAAIEPSAIVRCADIKDDIVLEVKGPGQSVFVDREFLARIVQRESGFSAGLDTRDGASPS